MHVFIANFANVADLAAEQDDPTPPDLELMASPSFFSVSAELTDAWVDRLKADVLDDLGCTPYSDDGLSLDWTTDGWIAPERGRQHQRWDAYHDGELMAFLIVQREEVL